MSDTPDVRQLERSLRESEARFQLMADSAPVLIWINGLEGCEFVNRAYREYLGVTDQDVRGFDWSRFVHPADRDAYTSGYVSAFESRSPFEAQFRFRRADGVYRWMKSLGQPRLSPDGAFTGYVGCSFDITDLKDAERVRTQTLAALAGEMRAHLAGLRDLSNALAVPSVEAVDRARESLGRQIRQVARLIDDLVDVGRVTAGRTALAEVSLPFEAIVARALASCQEELEQRAQRVSESPPERRLSVRGDPERLAQAIAALITGLSRFAVPGARLYLSWRRVETGRRSPLPVAGGTLTGPVVELVLTDGADTQTMLPQVYDLFAHEKGAEGAGINLRLAREMVELHEGTVEASSAGVGQGTMISVRLPLARPDEAAQATS